MPIDLCFYKLAENARKGRAAMRRTVAPAFTLADAESRNKKPVRVRVFDRIALERAW
jgi:hypothetical protein